MVVSTHEGGHVYVWRAVARGLGARISHEGRRAGGPVAICCSIVCSSLVASIGTRLVAWVVPPT